MNQNQRRVGEPNVEHEASGGDIEALKTTDTHSFVPGADPLLSYRRGAKIFYHTAHVLNPAKTSRLSGV